MLSSEVTKVIYSLSRIGNSDKPGLFLSKYEKKLFIVMIAVFIFMIVSGMFFYFTKIIWLKLLALILTLVFYFSAILWQVSIIIPMLRFFKNPTSDFLKVIESSATNELSAMTGLATVSNETIQYVADRLNLANQQLRARTAFLVGAVEKVGVLPGVIASLLALTKVSEVDIINGSSDNLYVYIAFALFIFYGFAVMGLLICQKFEVFSGVLTHYLHFRANKPFDYEAETDVS